MNNKHREDHGYTPIHSGLKEQEISRNKPKQASEEPLQWELTLPKKEIKTLENGKTALLMYL